MSERKVLNKYFPPDFDPDLIPRRKQPKNSQQVVRLMAPFSMRCNTCGEYIYKGKKFNAKKETKIIMESKSSDSTLNDYAAEHGASRNFEPWREEELVEEEDRLAKLEEEENNPMKVLENRTIDSKREMDILDALQDIRARNARIERVGQTVDVTACINQDEVEDEEKAEQKRLEEEDEKQVREIFSKVSVPAPSSNAVEYVTVKRKADEAEPPLRDLLPDSARALIDMKVGASQPLKRQKVDNKTSLGIRVVRKREGKQKIT
ncbi:hypothetical protein AX17_003742 [Amanita inopinata Kibby_2008]|nr:hypothetical protein AX17_003742 [Amanita inopinata Kibby_2008]